ncbi:EAL domain-containing protein [Sphingomonas floccifaciens]|uniref:EAL domain-containing protein n=1 Tax=Sphingomonas floccifaciens TaxID=1844115 RepID=A0ABW4NFD7_9SPHN
MTIAPPTRLLTRLAHREGPDDVVARRRSGIKILFWSTLAAIVIGVLGLAEPIEGKLHEMRDRLRPQTPSGQIVAIGIDDRSLEEVGTWPWPRQRHVDLIERLNAAGVRRIFFDVSFATKSDRAQDAALATALKGAGNVYLAAMISRDPSTGEHHYKIPRAEFRAHTRVISVSTKANGSAAIPDMGYATRLGSLMAPTMSAALAGRKGSPDETFAIDYAISAWKVPYVSAADVLAGRVLDTNIRGKDVVIGAASAEMGDVYRAPGVGPINGMFIQIVAAETLLAGGFRQLGWIAPLLLGFAACATYLFARRRWVGRSAVILALAFAAFGPLVAEDRGLTFEIMPLLACISIGAGYGAWARFRSSYKVRGNINAVSGLPNLAALREETAADAVVVAARIRNFAEISSALPPEAERALVEQIVGRLALGARGARIYQGDEGIFVWTTTPEVAGPDQLDALHALFRSPALIDGKPIDLSMTLGIDADGTRTLANRIGATLVAADEAASEGLRWKAYDPAKLADAEWKLSLLGQLDSAIDSGEIWVAYQPQIELATGAICGAEALVRWSHPEKGQVSPMEFVLAAEQHNRIDKLTAFVLGDALRAAADFAAQGLAFDIAVNMSARLLEKPGLVAMVQNLLADSGLSAERLTLEVTESAAMDSGRASIRTLEEIGSLGINVSIDDYGTGFSTLEYFKKIPATEVKIDRSFVQSIDRSASDRVMVRSTIELAHSLGRSVVAEGVETPEILNELIALGCDKAQGYLIGRPMKLTDLANLMRDQPAVRAA